MNANDSTIAAHDLGLAEMATLACIWEVTAPKPGNVYRGADFEDATYADFVTAAAVIGPIVAQSGQRGFGETLLAAVEATQAAVATNTNLGALLLLVPLAATKFIQHETAGTKSHLSHAQEFLGRTIASDTRLLYQAIRTAQAGGLGRVEDGDLADDPPDANVVEVMRLAAARDTIARQFINGFAEVDHAATFIDNCLQTGECLSEAIVAAALDLQARWPDSLIARKRGESTAKDASRRAAAVLACRNVSPEAYFAARQDFDFWLRADGHRRNPGTTADMIAAALFVLLGRNRISWPVRFLG